MIELGRTDSLRRREFDWRTAAKPAVRRQFAMLGHPAFERARRDRIAVFRFELLRRIRGRIAKIVKRYTVEDKAERISFVTQRRRRRREHTSAQLALPELSDFKFLAAGALADEPRAAAMRAALGQLGSVWNAMGG